MSRFHSSRAVSLIRILVGLSLLRKISLGLFRATLELVLEWTEFAQISYDVLTDTELILQLLKGLFQQQTSQL